MNKTQELQNVLNELNTDQIDKQAHQLKDYLLKFGPHEQDAEAEKWFKSKDLDDSDCVRIHARLMDLQRKPEPREKKKDESKVTEGFNARDLAYLIQEALEQTDEDGEPLYSEVTDIQDYKDVGMLTNDTGLVIKMGNKEFHVVVKEA